jgi:hypothetical protein
MGACGIWMRGREGGVAVLAVGFGAVAFDLAAEEVETPAATTLGVTAATVMGLEPDEPVPDVFFPEFPWLNATPALITKMNVSRDSCRAADLQGG